MRNGIPPLFLALLISAALPAAAAPSRPSPEDAVKIEIDVAPKPVAPGGVAEVTVQLSVNPGFKLNKYPKIKLAVPAVAGLVSGGETSQGTDGAPPPDRLDTNYFKSLDPLRLKLDVTPSAAPGLHDLDARLSYFYCVAASGYCAPAKISLKIPLVVR
jgi:hypothetical protein